MIKKTDFFNLLVFLFSPFLVIPSLILGIVNKSKFALFLFVIIFGIASYMYIPHITNDRARYFELYEDFKDTSYLQLFAYLMLTGQDFLLQSMFYSGSKLNISPQVVFALTTIITIGLIFSVYFKIILNNLNSTPKTRLLSLIFILVAIPYVDLFSGTRFMFATSFIIVGFYKGLIERNIKSIIYLLIAVCIHFSVYIFILIFLVLYIFPKSDRTYSFVFLISFLFVLIPPDFYILIFNFFGFSGGLEIKRDVYIMGEDFIKKGIEESYLQKILYYLNLLGVLFIYYYTFFQIKHSNILRNILLLTATVINIFFSVPTIFFRYSIILNFFFILFLVYELTKYNKKLAIYFYSIILTLIFMIQILFSLQNITKTYFNKHSIFLITILNNKPINQNDFIE